MFVGLDDGLGDAAAAGEERGHPVDVQEVMGEQWQDGDGAALVSDQPFQPGPVVVLELGQRVEDGEGRYPGDVTVVGDLADQLTRGYALQPHVDKQGRGVQDQADAHAAFRCRAWRLVACWSSKARARARPSSVISMSPV